MILILKADIPRAVPGYKEPTAAQKESGKYPKQRRDWNGLTIAIENPVGTVREGVDEIGRVWRTVFKYDYGEVVGSEGADGDPVDVYMGLTPDAPEVYIVRQMKRKNWDQYDEDKCYLGFDSMESAKAAYLAHYDDPRFFGGITAMPVDEFVRKVRATSKEPGMIKSILFFKSDKLSDSMRSRIGAVGSEKREDEPGDVFLEPGSRKYPVKIKEGGKWVYSPKLLEAAAARARMEGREDLAGRADKIRAKL